MNKIKRSVLGGKVKVGTKVRILRTDIKDKPSNKGTVVSIDGAYLTIRFYRTRRLIELYPNEVALWIEEGLDVAE